MQKLADISFFESLNNQSRQCSIHNIDGHIYIDCPALCDLVGSLNRLEDDLVNFRAWEAGNQEDRSQFKTLSHSIFLGSCYARDDLERLQAVYDYLQENYQNLVSRAKAAQKQAAEYRERYVF